MIRKSYSFCPPIGKIFQVTRFGSIPVSVKGLSWPFLLSIVKGALPGFAQRVNVLLISLAAVIPNLESSFLADLLSYSIHSMPSLIIWPYFLLFSSSDLRKKGRAGIFDSSSK